MDYMKVEMRFRCGINATTRTYICVCTLESMCVIEALQVQVSVCSVFIAVNEKVKITSLGVE